MKNFQRLKTFAKNLRGMATDEVVTRADFSLDHAPDWVFEVMNGGVALAGGVSNEMEIPGLSRPADNVLMVAVCLIARRNAIGKVPVRLSDSEGNVLQSGQLYDLFSQPNRDMTWGQYVRVLETHKSLYNFVAVGLVGQRDALVEPGELPSEMVPLSPANLSPVMGTHGPTGTPMIAYYRYADALTGAIVTYQPHQILVHRGFNPHAPLASLSPLNVLRRTMQGDIAAREQNLALQKNGSTPAGVLQADGPMRQEQAEEVVDFWEKRMKGYASRGKIAATWGGLKYQAIGLSPVEMEYINGLKFLRTDYFMIFRIPPEMVYETTPVSMGAGNQAKSSATIQWWEDEGLGELQLFSGLHKPVLDVFAGRGVARCCRSMRGMTRSERQAHSSWIARQETAGNGEIEMWFNENAIPCLVEHRLGKMSQAKDLIGLGYLPDDVNENLELGLPPHPDNKPRVASSVVVIGEEVKAAAAAGPKSQVAGDVTDVEGEEDQGEMQDALERFEQLLIARAEKQTEDKKALRKKYDAFLAPREKAAARKISGFFVEQRSRVLARAKEHGDLLVRTDSETHATALIKAVFPRDQEDMHLVARLSPLWNQHLKDGADLLAEETRLLPRFASEGGQAGSNPMQIDASPAFKQALENRKIQGAKINDTTEEALRGLMRDAFDSGDTMQQMADRIAAYYADNCIGEDALRALVIAQAQTAGIVNEGRMIAANEAGGLLKGWLHGGSAEPRPGHVRADQLYMAAPIPLNQKFEFQGGDGELYTCDQPGDSSLPASEVCNCSCMVTFVKAPSSDLGRTDTACDIIDTVLSRFDPEQPRDEKGMWTDTAGGGMSWKSGKGNTVTVAGDKMSIANTPFAQGVTIEEYGSVQEPYASQLKSKGLDTTQFVQMGSRGPIFPKSDKARLDEAVKRAKAHRDAKVANPSLFDHRAALQSKAVGSYSAEDFPGTPKWHAHQKAQAALASFDTLHPEIKAAVTEKSQAATRAKMAKVNIWTN